MPWPARADPVGRGLGRARRGTRRRCAGSPRRCRRRPPPAAARSTSVPPGPTTCTGRSEPPLAGMVGSTAVRSANATADTVTASTALTLPRACGSVPVKSKVISSPAIVTVTTIRRRALLVGAGAGGVEHVLEPPPAVGQRGEHGAHPALAVGDDLVERLRRRARRSRSTPTTLAPICASRSPARSSGVRDAASSRPRSSSV